MARRARSAERLGTIGDATLGCLMDILDRMWREPVRPRDHFKAPHFDGTGEVNLFIRQFTDVARANEWGDAARVLHLREVLKDTATDCGKAENVEAIFGALRARFGMSVREARAKLAILKRDYKITLQEHASDVERLVGIAYEDLPVLHREQMTLDTFHSTLGNAYLQRHLLAVPMPNLETAVRAGNDYLQIKPTGPGPAVRVIDGEHEPEIEGVHVAQAVETPIDTLTKMVLRLGEEIKRVQDRPGRPSQYEMPEPARKAQGSWKQPGQCWGCGKTGHIRRDCNSRQWENPEIQRRRPNPGNEQGPQQ